MSAGNRGAAHRLGPDSPSLPDETIGANLSRIAAAYPDRDALVECATGRRWTYAQFDAAAADLARGMLAAGVAKGDRVGIWSPNCAEWVLVQYAAAKAGAILVNLNPAYRDHEIRFTLKQSGTSLLFAATQVKTSDYVAMVNRCARTARSCRTWSSSARPAGPPSSSAVRRSPPRRSPSARAACIPTTPWTSSTRPALPDSPRAPRCRIATSWGTATWSPRSRAGPTRTASAFRYRCTTASAW